MLIYNILEPDLLSVINRLTRLEKTITIDNIEDKASQLADIQEEYINFSRKVSIIDFLLNPESVDNIPHITIQDQDFLRQFLGASSLADMEQIRQNFQQLISES